MNTKLLHTSSFSGTAFFIGFLIAIAFLSCDADSGNAKKASDIKETTMPKTYPIDTLYIPDHYTVLDADTALYSQPDTTAKIIGLLTTNDLAEASLESGDFVYVSSEGTMDTVVAGWIHKKHLKKALLTPPVINPENKLK